MQDFLKHLYNKYYERFKDLDTMKWIYGAYNLGEPKFDREYRRYGINIEQYRYHEGGKKWREFQDKLKRWEKEYNNKYKKRFR